MTADIILFPFARLQRHHVLIETQWVPSIQGRDFGVRKYVVSLVTTGNEPFPIWEGTTHSDALLQAREWSLPIADLVAGGAA